MGLRCINDSPDFRSPLRLFSLSLSSPTQSIVPVTEAQIIEKKKKKKVAEEAFLGHTRVRAVACVHTYACTSGQKAPPDSSS